MRKDNVDLICSIGEIAGLFEKSQSLEDFLQTVVNIVAYHMRAAVCSVYLYEDETQELVLTATQGLDLKARQVRLKLGEGLTGTALKELRAIREGNWTTILPAQIGRDIGAGQGRDVGGLRLAQPTLDRKREIA